MGALNYNLNKLRHPEISRRAKLLDTNFTASTLKEVKKELDLLRELRPNLNRYVYHTSLNFAAEDEALLSNEKLLAIAYEYLHANGFDNNQYMIFRHYDSAHPHLHLLVNRICFDGSVVSDSNNYKRSEEILRGLERKYDLTTVAPSRNVQQKAAKKDEIEMAVRTGKPSEKMVLQEKLNHIINQPHLNMQDFIGEGEAQGIHFLFNQASTGRISGITYFQNQFKITGKALGNRFKWSEIIKSINYEQVRDSKAVSEANSRTKDIYGDGRPSGDQRGTGRNNSGIEPYTGGTRNSEPGSRKPGLNEETGTAGFNDRERSPETIQADDPHNSFPDLHDNSFDHNYLPQISEDVDDEAVYGKSRKRFKPEQGMSR